MKFKAKWKLTHVRNHLGDLLAGGGGVTRDEAVAEAGRLVEIERQTSQADICLEIASIEAILFKAAQGQTISETDQRAMLHRTSCLLTLTGTFGFDALDAIGKSLCDLLGGMIRQDLHAIEPIAVHVQAMRLFAPTAAPLHGSEAAKIRLELTRIVAHLGCEQLANLDDSQSA